ncbi:MAG: 1-acyl-sn-glycerol-3-phosphate acyltransferase, partial [Treponema sp.]|nr:1-acyl-sn-glycerol-3-phosphate acyltransferase [Treponema sp.]
LPIARDNAREGLKTILKAIDYISADKVSVGIFPEGSRGVELQEFKPGSFKIAEKTRCPVVVCCMKGTGNIHVNWPWRKTDVYMDILEVIEPSVWDKKNTVEVSQYAHDIIYNDINKKSNIENMG